jgi:hypothetical protein
VGLQGYPVQARKKLHAKTDWRQCVRGLIPPIMPTNRLTLHGGIKGGCALLAGTSKD